MHHTGTSRILFHISIGVISKAITEHGLDPSYMIIFSFLPAQPRYNSRKAWQPFSAMKLKDAYSLKESYDQLRQHIQKQRHYFANKGPASQGYGFPSGHVWMRELDCEES